MLLSFLVFLSIHATAAFNCVPDTVYPLAGNEYPPTGQEAYPDNTQCTFVINPPQGKFIQLRVTNSSAQNDMTSLTFQDGKGLFFRYQQGSGSIASPIPITVKLLSMFSGYLKLEWDFYQVPFPNASSVVLSPDDQPSAFLQTELLFNNAQVVHCNNPMAILANHMPDPIARTQSTYAFIYAGFGTQGVYLGSFHSIIHNNPDGFLLVDKAPYIVTIVSASAYDYGIGLVKDYTDIQNYTYELNYAKFLPLGDQIQMDGRDKPYAVTLFNNDETIDYYLNSVDFTVNTGKAVWQTGDLTPKVPSLAQYRADDSSSLLVPQAIPGRLNTFAVKEGVARSTWSYKTPPTFDHVPLSSTTVFASRNYPSNYSNQGHSVSYSTDYIARLTVTVTQSTDTSSVITVTRTSNGIIESIPVASGGSLSVAGNHFTITYPNSGALDGGAAASVQFNFADATIPTNSPKTTTPSGSSHGINGIIVIVTCVLTSLRFC